ncbi:hypothetical protein ACIRF8_04560 [Streptomyces sp. NPDC102406]|uniref:hypothetical protein n=1 Tax=Streptomyces sp. NPDC102406 TaxID=3366171 RepID=UPI003821BF76
MPLSIIEEADRLLGVAMPSADSRSSSRSVLLDCPSCGSLHVAQMLGDNGGISYVCTACGHCWS